MEQKSEADPKPPSVGDVHRRLMALLWPATADERQTIGDIRKRLIEEFGQELFDAAKADMFGPCGDLFGPCSNNWELAIEALLNMCLAAKSCQRSARGVFVMTLRAYADQLEKLV
jgi:hypothetical protein